MPPLPRPPCTTYERLRHCIAQQMRMSPLDQPLMPLELLVPGVNYVGGLLSNRR